MEHALSSLRQWRLPAHQPDVLALQEPKLTDSLFLQPGVPDLQGDQRRTLALTGGGLRVVCLYVANARLVVGNFDATPEDRDVRSLRRWEGRVLVSPVGRQAFRAMLDLGLSDAFRLFEQPGKVFSGWNYGALGSPRNSSCSYRMYKDRRGDFTR